MGKVTHTEQIRGRVSEDKFLNAMELFRKNRDESPSWIRGVRKANRTEDQRGIDFIVRTDVGDINVQIKSSIGGVVDYIRSHADIPFEVCIIVVSEEEPYLSLFKRTRTVLAKRRQAMLSGTQERFHFASPPLIREGSS